MKTKQPYRGLMAALSLWLALVMVLGDFRPALAGMEDTAMFYEELSQYGQWVDYENYGPVWIPSQVQENWRPYTDGRWTPTDQGYVFETQEPWGWATYHYGNWMPTPNYGWVWVPGRTWYPSTVDWRTTPENTPAEEAYIGWAPIPPPNYVAPPMPAYAPPADYYPGSPVTDLLTAPFYIFAQAASFLLGLGQAFTPSYSYVNVGVLAPPAYVPTFFPRTVLVTNYVTPGYYPPVAFMGLGRGRVLAAYNAGPPVAYVSRVTNISQTVINRNITNNTVNITKIRNVVAPGGVLKQNIALRNITPPALAQGRRLPPPHPVKDVQLAAANLGKPNVVKPPQNIPSIKGVIPKAPPVPPGTVKGVVGAGLPAKATQPLTPKMAQQIEKLPPGQKVVPARPVKPPLTAVKPPVPGEKPPTPGVTPPAVGVKPAAPGEKPPPVGVRPTAPGVKPTVPGEKPPVSGEKPPSPWVKPPAPGEKPPAPRAKPPEPGKPTSPAAVRKPPEPGPAAAPEQIQKQRQLQEQQRQRQQQLQQQRQREQQQLQRQREQQQQRQREQQLQQQRQREQQLQQRQRDQQRQQQMQQQRQLQMQQQQQRQQQVQQQKQREAEAREKAGRERQERERQQHEQMQRQQQQQPRYR